MERNARATLLLVSSHSWIKTNSSLSFTAWLDRVTGDERPRISNGAATSILL